MVKCGSMTENIQNILILSTTHNLTGVGWLRGLTHGIETHCNTARSVGFNGIEYIPTKRTQRQVAAGELTEKQIGFIGVLGQSFRGERGALAFLKPLSLGDLEKARRVLGAYLMYPSTEESLESLRRLQDRNPQLPVVLQSPESVKIAVGLKNKALILNPENFAVLKVDDLRDVGERVKELGFDGGICLDPYQFQRKDSDGRLTALANLETSVPELWDYTRVVHFDLGRIDLSGNDESVQDLSDAYKNNQGGRIFRDLRILLEQYDAGDNHPPIVFQVSYEGAQCVLEKSGLSIDEVKGLHRTVLSNVKNAMGIRE